MPLGKRKKAKKEKTVKRKPTVNSLKKKAWKLMSEYIRLRDCLKTTGTLTKGKCYTCGKVFSIKELQAGHLLDGRCGENLFDERGINAQCFGCNVWKHGNKEIYIPRFIQENGQELYDELMRQKRTPHRWNTGELETEIEALTRSIAYIQKL